MITYLMCSWSVSIASAIIYKVIRRLKDDAL